jgi:hypothetical protein
MKNILAENMRRFNTKNLREFTEAPGSTEWGAWLSSYAQKHGLKASLSPKTGVMTYSKKSLRGTILIESTSSIEWTDQPGTGRVGRLFVQVKNQRGEEVYNESFVEAGTEYAEVLAEKKWSREAQGAIEGILLPYVK